MNKKKNKYTILSKEEIDELIKIVDSDKPMKSPMDDARWWYERKPTKEIIKIGNKIYNVVTSYTISPAFDMGAEIILSGDEIKVFGKKKDKSNVLSFSMLSLTDIKNPDKVYSIALNKMYKGSNYINIIACNGANKKVGMEYYQDFTSSTLINQKEFKTAYPFFKDIELGLDEVRHIYRHLLFLSLNLNKRYNPNPKLKIELNLFDTRKQKYLTEKQVNTILPKLIMMSNDSKIFPTVATKPPYTISFKFTTSVGTYEAFVGHFYPESEIKAKDKKNKKLDSEILTNKK